MVLLVVLAMMILVPLIERQIVTLIGALPQMRDWSDRHRGAVAAAKKTGLELMTWLDPERLIEWIRSHWEQAGGVGQRLSSATCRVRALRW